MVKQNNEQANLQHVPPISVNCPHYKVYADACEAIIGLYSAISASLCEQVRITKHRSIAPDLIICLLSEI